MYSDIFVYFPVHLRIKANQIWKKQTKKKKQVTSFVHRGEAQCDSLP